MEQINYEDWKKLKRAYIDKMVEVENIFQGHAPGRRPRDLEKEKILTEMDKERMERLIASGKLEIVGPRKWKWRIFGPDKQS